MIHTRLRFAVATAIVAAIVLGGCASLGSAGTAPLQASGLIEASEVVLAPELSGRVVELDVAEGDPVKAGDPLLRLDDRLLQAQRQSTKTAGDAAIAAAQMEQVSAQQALDDLFTNAPLAAAQAEKDLAEARDSLDDAQRTLTYNQPGNRGTSDTVKGAKAKLAVARERMENAKSAYDHAPGHLEDGGAKAAAYVAYVNARTAYNTALAGYNWYVGHPSDIDQAKYQADVDLAQAQVNDAERRVSRLTPGPDLDAVTLAQARLKLAIAQLAAANAKAAVDLQTLDLQLDKLVFRSPIDGVVLTRSVNLGEVAQAGSPVVTLGKLDELKVTVYLPEDRYGQIQLGDHATLAVDTYPGETFDAVVTRIADQAEFTPRNVQTKEERQTTVYAIELSVPNPDGKLIPGMPADVTFEP